MQIMLFQWEWQIWSNRFGITNRLTGNDMVLDMLKNLKYTIMNTNPLLIMKKFIITKENITIATQAAATMLVTVYIGDRFFSHQHKDSATKITLLPTSLWTV